MSLVVRKMSPVVVRAPEPVTAAGKIDLSAYDLYFYGQHAMALLVFPHPIMNPAETIRRGLSQALLHYYPLSGRIHSDDGEVHIKCTGEGVPFVAASADGALADTKFSEQSVMPRALLDQLAVFYPGAECGDADPLLMMQVTEFSCGGFVVGVSWNHAVADGVGIGQFLQAVGEFSRGLPSPSVLPVRLDDTLAVPSTDVDAALMQLERSLQTNDNPMLDIAIPSSFINRIKDEFRASSDGRTCTEYEVVSAALWQWRTRAINADPTAPAVLWFPANARKHAQAKEGYYGNCITAELVVADMCSVANGDLTDLLRMIQCVKDEIPDKFSKDQHARDQMGPSLEELGAIHGYNTFGVPCWRKLGLEGINFGGGVPARVISMNQESLCLPICWITGTGEEGVCAVSACVKEEHADAFLAELARSTGSL